MFRLSKGLLIACLLTVPLGCDSNSPSAPALGQLTIEPGSVSLQSGQSVQFTATGEGGGAGLSWSSSNAAVATVDGSGMVTAHFTAGGAVITARAAGSEGQAEVNVVRACANPVVIDGDPGPAGGAVAEFDVRFAPAEDAAELTADFAAQYGFRPIEIYSDGFRAELTTAQINSIVCRVEVSSVSFV